MKNKPIIISVVALTVLVEGALMISIFYTIGDARLGYQVLRLLFQLILLFYILQENSKIATFILTFYHIVAILLLYKSKNASELLAQLLIVYHVLIGLLVYFHEFIERKIKKTN